MFKQGFGWHGESEWRLDSHTAVTPGDSYCTQLRVALHDDHYVHTSAMSLPRSDYDPRRVSLNPFPFLNKINLGKHRRTFSVYLAGGLISPSLPTTFPS